MDLWHTKRGWPEQSRRRYLAHLRLARKVADSYLLMRAGDTCSADPPRARHRPLSGGKAPSLVRGPRSDASDRVIDTLTNLTRREMLNLALASPLLAACRLWDSLSRESNAFT